MNSTINKFDPAKGLVVVIGRVWGPVADADVRMALDTGATGILVSARIMEFVGFDLKACTDHVRMTTGSGIAHAPRLKVPRFDALGHSKSNLNIVCHSLPKSATIDGLLGLDFFRGLALTLDFRTGTIQLK